MNRIFSVPVALLIPILFFLLNNCALKHPRVITIPWPQTIDYIEAMGELDMSWKGLKYTGELSLKLDYPETLSIDVYGPFGSTIVSVKKDKNSFIMRAGNDELKDEKQFHNIFKIKIEDFMNDVTLRGERNKDSDGNFFIQRAGYRTIYYLNDSENKICWVSPEGIICITFQEVSFDKGPFVGKNSDKSMQ